MNIRDILALNLRVLRELHGLGQLELAERVGVSRRTIARLESAEIADPGVEQVHMLARALRVTPAMLTTTRLAPVSLALPVSVRAKLESDRGPELCARIAQLVSDLERG